MNRDEFLQMMIAHLEEMNEEEEKNQANSQNVNHFMISDILKKLSFDFPLLDDQQIRILSEFLVLFGTPNYDDGENFKVTSLFLDNMKYIRSSPTYSQYQNTCLLFEGIFLYLPLALMKYNKFRLIEILDRSQSNEITWNDLFHEVYSLIDITLPSTFVGNRTSSLSESTIVILLNTLSQIVHLLTPSDSNSTSDISSLNDYYSNILRSVVSQTSLEIEPNTQQVVKKTINLFTGLLFLIRDLCTLNDNFSIRVIPLLFDQVLIPLLQIPSRQLESIGYIVGAGIILQLQLSCLFLMSDLCSSFLLDKPEKVYQEVRKKLSYSLCRNMSIVVSSVEMIVNSIMSDQSIARSASDKLLSQMLESLITYTAITCVAIGSKNEFPFNVNFDLLEILLSSRLFSVLSAFLVKIEDGTMPVATFYQSLHIDVKLRLFWTLATISQLADPSLSIYIHKIFLPIILRCESQRPLSQLHTARTNIATISLVPIIAMLMGSIKSNQNQTVIKSFEKSLTAYMESCGDTREIMSCSTHLNDIIEHMLPEFVDEIVVKYEFINSHPTTRFNEENSDASDSVEDENQRHLQRSQQDLKLLLQQPLNLVELFLRVQHQGSSLPIEYIRSSEVIITAFTELTRRLNSIPQISDISEMKKLVHQLIKLIKSLSNYITSNNSKTD